MSRDEQLSPGSPDVAGFDGGDAARDQGPAVRPYSIGVNPVLSGVDALRAGLAGLDSTGRRAVELAYFRGMTVPTIASLLALSEAEIRLAMRSAMLQLGSLVRDGGADAR